MRMQKSVIPRPKATKSTKTTFERIATGTTIAVSVCKLIEFWYSEAGQVLFQSFMGMISMQ